MYVFVGRHIVKWKRDEETWRRFHVDRMRDVQVLVHEGHKHGHDVTIQIAHSPENFVLEYPGAPQKEEACHAEQS